jgi:hypothetical protein
LRASVGSTNVTSLTAGEGWHADKLALRAPG